MKPIIAGILLFVLLPAAPQDAPPTADIPSGRNLLGNPGLEGRRPNGLPPGWEAFAIGPPAQFAVDSELRHHGRQSVRIRFAAANSASEVTRSYLRSAPIPVAPGEQIRVGAWVRHRDVPPGQGTVIAIAEFTNAAGKNPQVAKVGVAMTSERARERESERGTQQAPNTPSARSSAVPQPLPSLSRSRALSLSAAGGWEHIQGTATVPPLCANLRLRLGFSYSRGTCWWDDVTVEALQPLVARIELARARVVPAMEALPVTLLNRAGQRDPIRLRVRLGAEEALREVTPSGAPVQRVDVPFRLARRGRLPLQLALLEPGREAPLFVDERAVTVPPPLVLLPPIPTHWVREDGVPSLEGEVELSVTRAEQERGVLAARLLDAAGQARATWSSATRRLAPDAVIHFSLRAPGLDEGSYRLLVDFSGEGALRVGKGIANCKLQIANCKFGCPVKQGGTKNTASPDRDTLRSGTAQFTICNLQFAICNPLPSPQRAVPKNPRTISAEKPWSVIPRRRAKVTLNKDGYLEQDGKTLFPLGLFNGGARMEEAAAAGFTVAHAYNAVRVEPGERPDDQRASDFLDRAGKAGMRVLFLVPMRLAAAGDWEGFRRRIRMFRNHPALLAWDEEGGIARGDIPPATLAKIRRVLREEDPHHPLMVGDSRDVIGRVADRSNFFPLASMDLGMWWWYPFPLASRPGSALAGEEQARTLELEPPSFLTRRNTEKPIWVGVQSYKKPNPGARYPTPAEYRAQAYVALIHGARGLLWYGGSVTGGLFLSPQEGHWEELKTLVRELKGSAWTFMQPSVEPPHFLPANAPISVALKRLGKIDALVERTRGPQGLEVKTLNLRILLAVNRGAEAVDVRFRIPEITPEPVPVWGENRSIIATAGELRDRFEPYAVHIYQLSSR